MKRRSSGRIWTPAPPEMFLPVENESMSVLGPPGRFRGPRVCFEAPRSVLGPQVCFQAPGSVLGPPGLFWGPQVLLKVSFSSPFCLQTSGLVLQRFSFLHFTRRLFLLSRYKADAVKQVFVFGFILFYFFKVWSVSERLGNVLVCCVKKKKKKTKIKNLKCKS